MIQEIRIANLEARLNCTGTLITGPINQSLYSSLNQSSCAHCTGLNRRINNGADKAVISNPLRRFTQRNQLSVTAWIAVCACPISRNSQQPIIENHARTDRHFSTLLRFPGG
jgi:hypothetical protein